MAWRGHDDLPNQGLASFPRSQGRDADGAELAWRTDKALDVDKWSL